MRYRRISENPKTFILVFDTGDELLGGLKWFAEEEQLSGSSFKAVGGLSRAKFAWFSWESKKYELAADLNEQLELLSLIGDIALKDGKPQVHAHMIVGRRDGSAHGGHMMEAQVRPTCEVVLTETPAHLQKQVDPESGLALINL